MGVIKEGVLGGFSGKVGAVIGGSWKGISYMRGRGAGTHYSNTADQEQQRLRFALMVGFLRSISGIIDIGYRNYAIKMTEFNSAMSYNIKNGITEVGDVMEIDYPMILVSRGDLPNADNPQATAGTAGQINFSWTNNADTGKALADDKCLALVYSPTQKLAKYSFYAADRSEQALVIDAPQFSGRDVETYITFVSANKRETANSLYCGQVSVV